MPSSDTPYVDSQNRYSDEQGLLPVREERNHHDRACFSRHVCLPALSAVAQATPAPPQNVATNPLAPNVEATTAVNNPIER
jgi:hypothetical protein